MQELSLSSPKAITPSSLRPIESKPTIIESENKLVEEVTGPKLTIVINQEIPPPAQHQVSREASSTPTNRAVLEAADNVLHHKKNNQENSDSRVSTVAARAVFNNTPKAEHLRPNKPSLNITIQPSESGRLTPLQLSPFSMRRGSETDLKARRASTSDLRQPLIPLSARKLMLKSNIPAATPKSNQPLPHGMVTIAMVGKPVFTMAIQKTKIPEIPKDFEGRFKQWYEAHKKENFQPIVKKEATKEEMEQALKFFDKECGRNLELMKQKSVDQYSILLGNRKRYSEKSVTYPPEKIDEALSAFKACGCNFAYMKHNHLDLMDVIADMRAFELDNILDQLNIEYFEKNGETFKEIDLGAPEATSDRDISIMAKNRESRKKEIEVVEKFNAHFEKIWGQSSAKVFDSNLYTSFYLESYITNEVRNKQMDQQTKMSLLMFRIQSELSEIEHPSPWEMLKADLLKNEKGNGNQLEILLKEVENDYRHVLLERSREILRLGLRQAGRPDADINDILTSGSEDDIIRNAKKIQKGQPDIFVLASNNLHHTIRARAKEYFDRHEAVIKLFTSNKENFAGNYKNAVQAIIGAKEDQLKEVDAHLSKPPTSKQADDKFSLEESIKYWQKMQNKMPVFDNMEAFFKENMSRNPNELQFKSETETGKILIDLFGIEADLILLKMQDIDAKGRCHAQEIHISEGGYAFTVEDIQAGSKELRSAGHYRQANNELLGFYFSHQQHAPTQPEKMIESSKYIVRLSECIERMEKRAVNLGKANFPKLSKEDQALFNYFKEIFSLRKNKVSPETLARATKEGNKAILSLVQKDGKIGQKEKLEMEVHIKEHYMQSCPLEVLNNPNERLTQIVSQINGWADTLSSKELLTQ